MHALSDPIRREESDFPAVEALALALRAACAQAAGAGSFAMAMPVLRMAVSLANSLRATRAALGLPMVWDAAAVQAIERTMRVAAAYLADESLTADARLRLCRTIGTLGRIAVRARIGTPMRGMRQDPIRREAVDVPPAPQLPSIRGGGEPATDIEPQDPIQPEDPPVPSIEPAPMSAWRNDHTTERDIRAHELLKVVMEDRVFSKVHIEARRLRAEREAWEAAARAHTP